MPVLVQLPVPVISSGSHDTFGDGACALELVDYLHRARLGLTIHEGTELTDEPACVSPIIATFVRFWNDGMGDHKKADEVRTRLLGPLLLLMLDTRTTGADEDVRAWMVVDFMARVQAPAWLELAGLGELAASLRGLKAFTCDAVAIEQQEIVSAARSAAESAARSAAESAARSAAESAAWSAAVSAARSAAWSAAVSAARSAAWSAARSAAESAARSAAESAAWSAAVSAAESAAWSAAWSALDPTVQQLQLEAVELVRRMCAVGREEVSRG